MQSPNKTMLITGAAGNLGSVVSQYFLDEGYQVIAIVSPQTGALPPHQHRIVMEADLSNETATLACVQEAIARHGTIDGALLLAGGFAMGGIADTGTADLRKQLTLNFDTAYNVARPLLAHFREKGKGRLVFVGARPALVPEAGKDMLAYALSKSLLFQLADYINAETKGTNITASVIVPSTIDTPANRAAMPDANYQDWVSPQALARAMAFLCSDDGSALRQTVLKLYNNA